jgi:hypothetical protein
VSDAAPHYSSLSVFKAMINLLILVGVLSEMIPPGVPGDVLPGVLLRGLTSGYLKFFEVAVPRSYDLMVCDI